MWELAQEAGRPALDVPVNASNPSDWLLYPGMSILWCVRLADTILADVFPRTRELGLSWGQARHIIDLVLVGREAEARSYIADRGASRADADSALHLNKRSLRNMNAGEIGALSLGKMVALLGHLRHCREQPMSPAIAASSARALENEVRFGGVRACREGGARGPDRGIAVRVSQPTTATSHRSCLIEPDRDNLPR